jgi:hypothetical protein
VLFAALRANSHLRSLDLRGNRLSGGCLREHGLPALRANASLREVHIQLLVGMGTDARMDDALVAELAALLASRGA